MKSKIFKKIESYNNGYVSISNYTIMVSNLESSLTEKEIKEYFEKITKYRVLKINFAYDIHEYMANFKKKIKLLEQ